MQICPGCVGQLESTLLFLEQCLRSQKALQQHLWMSIPEVSIKDEAEIKQESDVDGHNLPDGIFTTASAVLNQLDDSSEPDNDDDVPLSLVKRELRSLRKFKLAKCGECGKSFRDVSSLHSHQAAHASHVCANCDEKFITLRKLRIHMRVRHSNGKRTEFSCKYCSERFNSRTGLDEHKQAAHPEEMLTCDVCQETLDSEEALTEHKKCHAGTRVFRCSLCSKSFKNSKSLKNHNASIHVGLKRFVCHCGHSFHRRARLQYHIDYVHEKKDERNYQCEECPKKFRNMEALRVHRKIHSDLKPYSCQACGKDFRLRSQLQSHFVRIHSSDKSSLRTHLCDNCGKSFDCKANLQSHILRQHTVNPERNVQCPICNRKYLDKKSVRRHMRMHNDAKPFLCTQCARWFKTAPMLQDHINRIHLELRPFECATCGSKFKMNKDLAKHMRTHTGERPYPCPYCSYTCAVKSNLQKHISNIHLKGK